MKRRNFLVQTLAGSAALLTRSALAQQAGHAMPSMTPMHGMGHAPTVVPVAPAPPPPPPAPLAAPDALPSGAPLPDLFKLPSASPDQAQAQASRLFRAALAAQPTTQTFLDGKDTAMWQYTAGVNESPDGIAGPLIDVHEGDRIEIRFDNRLPEPSTIHWHGLPVPPDQDGNPEDAVPPGAARIYQFKLPPGSAGSYWYHPHPHMQTAEQVFRGLAGPIIVRAADDPLAAWPEKHLFFSDLRLDVNGNIPPNGLEDWMNGREGQYVLINGALRPEITVDGDQRWRIWNACSARYLKLAFSDHRAFTQVGTDGGLLKRPITGVRTLLLPPGARAELIVQAGPANSQATLMALAYNRGKMSLSGNPPAETDLVLAQVKFAPSAGGARTLPAWLRPIEPLGESAAQKTVMMTEQIDMQNMHAEGPMGLPSGMRFLINNQSFDPKRVNMTCRRNEVEIWTVQNFTDMDHPFHIHGTQFQVLDHKFEGKTVPESFLAWRDTVNLRPNEVVRIATVQRTAGLRMFHCHILEHEDLGMMATLQVEG
jgi:bilirubin oxidase